MLAWQICSLEFESRIPGKEVRTDSRKFSALHICDTAHGHPHTSYTFNKFNLIF